MKLMKCERCGVCCFTGPCSKGDEDGEYGCSHLLLEGDHTTCELILTGKMEKNEVAIGEGCVLDQCSGNYRRETLERFNKYKIR